MQPSCTSIDTEPQYEAARSIAMPGQFGPDLHPWVRSPNLGYVSVACTVCLPVPSGFVLWSAWQSTSLAAAFPREAPTGIEPIGA